MLTNVLHAIPLMPCYSQVMTSQHISKPVIVAAPVAPPTTKVGLWLYTIISSLSFAQVISAADLEAQYIQAKPAPVNNIQQQQTAEPVAYP